MLQDNADLVESVFASTGRADKSNESMDMGRLTPFPQWVPNTYTCGIPPLTHGWFYWFVNWPSNVRGVEIQNVTPTSPRLHAEVDVNSPRVMHQYYSVREGVTVPDEAGPLVGYAKYRHADGQLLTYAIHMGLIDN